MDKRGKTLSRSTTFRLILILLLVVVFIPKVSGFCRVEGYIKNYYNNLTKGNVSVFCQGLDQVKTISSNTYYLAIFGDLTDNCNICEPEIISIASNSTLNVNGSASTSSLNVAQIWLNITMKEWNAPVVEFGIPINKENITSSNINFSLKCYDDSNPSILILYGNWSGGWHANETNFTPENNSWWNITITLPDGLYKWAGYCKDIFENEGWTSENRTFIVDFNGPTINLTNPTNGSIEETKEDSKSVDLKWIVKDAISNSITCKVYIDNSLKKTKNCTSGVICTESVILNALPNPGKIYTWQVNCSDERNNNGSSELWNFFVKKTTEDGGGGGGGSGGSGGGGVGSICGDEYCSSNENYQNCCLDCGCPSNQICINNICKVQLTCICGDNICNPLCNETIINCPEDCQITKSCGNGMCEPGKNETYETCPEDCPLFYNICGDKRCRGSETSANCCVDCGCSFGKKCIKNKCEWQWIWLLILFVLAIVITLAILIPRILKTDLFKIITKIRKQIRKKEVKLVYKKFDFKHENKKIETLINKGIKIYQDKIKYVITLEEKIATEALVEKKKKTLKEINNLFNIYKKIIEKEILVQEEINFNEDKKQILKELVIKEEKGLYNELRKKVFTLYTIEQQIKKALQLGLRIHKVKI